MKDDEQPVLLNNLRSGQPETDGGLNENRSCFFSPEIKFIHYKVLLYTCIINDSILHLRDFEVRMYKLYFTR